MGHIQLVPLLIQAFIKRSHRSVVLDEIGFKIFTRVCPFLYLKFTLSYANAVMDYAFRGDLLWVDG